ncbi:MAG: Holliday junction resolvase RuvX [Planctomycetota bacterium]
MHYQDERLTTHAADQQLAGSGRTHKEKKELRDTLAAAEILRDFLRSRS